MGKVLYPLASDQNGAKTLPDGVAHTGYRAYVPGVKHFSKSEKLEFTFK